MTNLKDIFKKVEGWKLIKQYIYSHVFLYFIFMILINGISKKSLEITRLGISNKIVNKLKKKHKKEIKEFKEEIYNAKTVETLSSNKVWMYWGQGMLNAPILVKKCYQSIKENIENKEIILLDDNNYREYVSFPEYIQEKIDKGIITKTHFSDLLRLELLIKYGGTWIDATVYCSGNNYETFMFESDLFFFQCLKPGRDGHRLSMSSWFLTSKANNNILKLTRKLLYSYWKKHKKMMDYFLLHDFMQIALEEFVDDWKEIIPVDNATEHILLLNFNETYNEKVWKYLKSQRAFHKLSYKMEIDDIKQDSYYNTILKG